MKSCVNICFGSDVCTVKSKLRGQWNDVLASGIVFFNKMPKWSSLRNVLVLASIEKSDAARFYKDDLGTAGLPHLG